MNDQIQTTQDTNPGTSKTLLAAEMRLNNRKGGPTRQALNEFLDDVAQAMIDGAEAGEALPSVETSREIVQYYNKTNMAGFDTAGYFIFQGVKVYEKGTKEAVDKRDNLTIEEKLFGAK